MKIEFDVEADRPHHVGFSFHPLRRGLAITLDGAPATYETRRFSAAGWDVHQYTFHVGTVRTRQITLEKWTRSGPLSTGTSGPKVPLPGLHPRPLRAFVDGALIAASDHQPTTAPPRPVNT